MGEAIQMPNSVTAEIQTPQLRYGLQPLYSAQDIVAENLKVVSYGSAA
jgi:hypothetical protein